MWYIYLFFSKKKGEASPVMTVLYTPENLNKGGVSSQRVLSYSHQGHGGACKHVCSRERVNTIR
jgi:hypothetical protein